MSLGVKERGETLATLRYIQVQIMEMLARWVPTTPEMEVKLVFGTHIWDVAQHADALGKRVHELRMPLQHSLRPVEAYMEVLAKLSAAQETGQRVAGMYGGVLPCLANRYRQYLDRTDPLMDAPTVRILDRILHDHPRMLHESEELYSQVPHVLPNPVWVGELREMESAIDDFVQHPPVAKSTQGIA